MEDHNQIEEVRKENDAILFAFTRLEWRLTNWGFACVELGEDSWAWYFPMVLRVGKLKGVFLSSVWLGGLGNTKTRGWLVHNCPVLHKALHSDSCRSMHHAGGENPASWPKQYASAMSSALKNLNEQALPICPSLRPSWVREELRKATKRLADTVVSHEASDALCKMLRTMAPGSEARHLHELIRFADHRGSEIRVALWSGAADQLFPYPAFAWKWKTVQSYAWHHDQHINILEFTAFFNYLRSLANKKHLQHMRLFHVFDSKVVCGVLGKGRSPSRRMNRCCRRLLPLLLGMDWYVMTLWTISGWEYADRASRIWHHDERC